MGEYTELQALSNFSFLRGASHPEEMVHRAAELSYRAIALTDYETLAGVVRAQLASEEAHIRFLVGTTLHLSYHSPLCNNEPRVLTVLVYPQTLRAYQRLSRLLTLGKKSAEKGSCNLSIEDFITHHQELVCTFVAPLRTRATRESYAEDIAFLDAVKHIRDIYTDPRLLSLALTRNYAIASPYRAQAIIDTARLLSLPLVATNDAHYHLPSRRPLHDVVTCIRTRSTIHRAGFSLLANAERHLKSVEEMRDLFRDTPRALSRTIEITEMLSEFSLRNLSYEYPHEVVPHECTPSEHLAFLVEKGLQERYPEGIPEKVRALVRHELALIRELRYEKYFLTCYDIVTFARSRSILCQGRGAAANSAVCFALGITSVDPARIELLFERFVSKERNEPPDIDIDFEHERREEVIQYIYERYGRDRAALTAEVVTYQPRSALREVGKALGMPPDLLDSLAKTVHRRNKDTIEISEDVLGEIDRTSPLIHNTLVLASQLLGFPRHLSQHVGGFIISESPLCEIVPILNAAMDGRTTIEWDKDDIEALGMLKIDVLALGMLTCIRKALTMINESREREGALPLALHSLPPEDPAVYDMICRADTIGVFQIESRAQMSMLPRLRPRNFYDLVIEVAIVRPGPIQGNMVHPYLKRRSGIETVSYPDARVEAILGKTLGVPLFQEQAMRLSIMLANFTPGEAERLRRAIGAWKRNKGVLASFKERIIRGMTANGYSLEFAESCFNQIRGFSEYGFPESHAASFALLVYASAWIKHRYPGVFAAALLNSQPMGFYQPSQIVRDAANHGVDPRPIDINFSIWDTRIEGSVQSLRLGMRLVKGLRRDYAETLSHHVAEQGRVYSIRDLWISLHRRGTPLPRHALEALARADAFQSLGLNRRLALWEIQSLPRPPRALDATLRLSTLPAQLPLLPLSAQMAHDYEATGLSLKAHPISFFRQRLTACGALRASDLRALPESKRGAEVTIAGMILIRQRPHTAKGITFLTIEDETGMMNLVLRPAVYEEKRTVILTSTAILARGFVERTTEVIYMNVSAIDALQIHLRDFEARNFC